MFEILIQEAMKDLLPNPNMLGGQTLFDVPGKVEWLVPDDVTSICAVCIGAGGARYQQWTSGGGGGLSWRNHIPVTPGETLTLQVGLSPNGNNSTRNTFIKRNDDILCIAYGGGEKSVAGGKGGKDAHPINDGGGNGGNGKNNGTNGIGAGGAGGYTGNGGNGSVSGKASTPGEGGGGGGGMGYNGKIVLNGTGGGVLPYGEFVSGGGKAPIVGNPTPAIKEELYLGEQGSIPDGTKAQTTSYGGGGGMSTNGGSGCIRIIWGEDRYYPNKNTHDVTGKLE